MEGSLGGLLIVCAVAVSAPLVIELPFPLRLPIVVVEIVLGILVGPQMLGWVEPDPVLSFFAMLGLAFLFFIAGLEIDFGRIRGRPLMLAVAGWLLSLVLALGTAFTLAAVGALGSPLIVAAALTTTAIGTLLPILRDAGELETRFGALMLAAGAVGEFGPILLAAFLFTMDESGWSQALVLIGFGAAAVAAAIVALRVHPPRIVMALARGMCSSSQLPVRMSIALLVGLAFLAEHLGLDLILGAFAAGMIVSLTVHGTARNELTHKLDGIGFGFFIPIFFIVSGMRFDLAALAGTMGSLALLPLFLLLFVLVRGLPALLYRRELAVRDLLPFALLSATALPLVVAITTIAANTGRLDPAEAAAMVGAGIVSVLTFPVAALALRRGARVE